MRKSGQILGRDIRRLLRVPRAFIIIVGVLITPALYAWFNINAFWDPYAHTQNIRIAVVNNDRGASAEHVGEVDVGEQITEQLKSNDKIGWVFLPEDEARDGLMRGDYYAMFLIPHEFSEDLLSLVSGTYTQPVLEYYVNEKSNGVTPSITDAGASAVDTAVSEAFKKKVGEAAATELRNTGFASRDDAEEVRGKASGSFGQIAADLDASQGRVATMKQSISGARPVVAELNTLVGSVDDTLRSVDSSSARPRGSSPSCRSPPPVSAPTRRPRSSSPPTRSASAPPPPTPPSRRRRASSAPPKGGCAPPSARSTAWSSRANPPPRSCAP